VIDTGSGDVVQRTDYDEFGNVTLEDTSSGFTSVPFGFAGGLLDGATGLQRFGTRDYDPTVARWTQKDPIGFEGDGLNLYEYVLTDPVNRNDLDGRVSYTNAGMLAAVSVSAVIHGISRGTGLSRFPHDNDKRHRFTSCVLTRRHLGIPAPLVSGPLFELATAIYRRQLDWRDIERDLSANLEGTIGAYDLSRTCDQVAR
jgi:RHS repeat-associated protein